SWSLVVAVLLCIRLALFVPQPALALTSTLSLHDALPILPASNAPQFNFAFRDAASTVDGNYTDIAAAIKLALASFPCNCRRRCSDPKSTRLNSSHLVISYAVLCLKKNTDPGAELLRLSIH